MYHMDIFLIKWYWNSIKIYPMMKVSKDRKSTRLNSSHANESRMPSSA